MEKVLLEGLLLATALEVAMVPGHKPHPPQGSLQRPCMQLGQHGELLMPVVEVWLWEGGFN